MTVFIKTSDLGKAALYFDEFPDVAARSMQLAMNDTISRQGFNLAAKTMEEEIAFPKGYLKKEGRLFVRRKATLTRLEVKLRGRDRPTSLARFATPGQTIQNTRGRGVKLKVKSGKSAELRRKAFLLNLRNNNVGLAVRLPEGERLQNSERAVKLENNVYLLYGPSVEQVFKGVSADITPEVVAMITKEFYRQFARLSRG